MSKCSTVCFSFLLELKESGVSAVPGPTDTGSQTTRQFREHLSVV